MPVCGSALLSGRRQRPPVPGTSLVIVEGEPVMEPSMRRTLIAGVIALAATRPLSAQESLALAAPPLAGTRMTVARVAPRTALLKAAYQVRLVSDWPQLSDGGLGCVNGGQEVLEGRLIQSPEGAYSGQLTRKASIRFCGVHGSAASVCTLTLTSEGTVSARAGVLTDGADKARVELRWFAPTGAAEALVEGDCSPQFNESVRRLYLGASHSVEFALPAAGEGPRTMRLDDYGWIVDVR